MKKTVSFVIGAYLFALPWDAFFLLETRLPASPSFLFLGLAGFIYLFLVLFNINTKLNLPKVLWPLILLLIFFTFSLLWTSNMSRGIYDLVRLWSYLGALILLYTLVKKMSLSVFGLLWFYISGVLSVGIYSWVVHGFGGGRFSISESFNPSWYAAFLAWAIIASVAVYPRSNTSGKAISIIAIVLSTILLLLTQGRNAAIALSLSLIIALSVQIWPFYSTHLLVRIKKGYLKSIAKALPIILLIVIGTTFIMYETEYYLELDRLETFFEYFGDDWDRATAGRYSLWIDFTKISLDQAFIGGGVSSAANLYGGLHLSERTPHNIYILTMVEYGIIGIILWLAFIIGIIRHAFLYQNKFVLVWIAFFSPIFGIGNDILYYKYWWMGLLLFLILISDHSRKVKNNEGYLT